MTIAETYNTPSVSGVTGITSKWMNEKFLKSETFINFIEYAVFFYVVGCKVPKRALEKPVDIVQSKRIE